MPLTDLGRLLDLARAGGYGVLAFNVIPLEYGEAIVAAAEATSSAVVLQLSENSVRYHGGRIDAIGRACRALAEQASVPVAIHLDHATTMGLVVAAADVGFGSVMFDGSALPAGENVRETADIVDWAHGRGLTVEAEIGVVGGKDGRHEAVAPTEPAEATRFVRETGVDALAVQVGTSHAMIERRAALDIERISKLHEVVPVPLVLHGSSGVPDEQLLAAIRAGLTKVNIGTRLNLAFTGGVRRHLASAPNEVDPRPYLGAGRSAVEAAALSLFQALGIAGHPTDVAQTRGAPTKR